MDPDRVQEVARAEEAKRLLDGPVFREAWQAAERAIMRRWEDAETTTDREACWAKMQGLKLMRKELVRIVQRGEYAARTSPRREESVE